MPRRRRVILLALLSTLNLSPMAVGQTRADDARHENQMLDPLGRVHLATGIVDTLDGLKTCVEPEGAFSPGFGSYGIYFWLFDVERGTLIAPTMPHVKRDHGLNGNGYLIPWSSWSMGGFKVRTEVCQVRKTLPDGDGYVVGARVTLSHDGPRERRVKLIAALRPIGPAGYAVNEIAVSDRGDALLVDGHSSIVARQRPSAAGVIDTDTIGSLALAGRLPSKRLAKSSQGNCSGAMAFDLTLAKGEARTFGFVCPVLAGRRVVGHQWDGVSTWVQADLAHPNPKKGGRLQPDPGLDYYRGLSVDGLFEEATAYWADIAGRVKLELPDPRWQEAFNAIVGHVAIALNEGAPDVAVLNYNVFNRDGVYVANIFQKAGRLDLAQATIEYFLSHPFSGRSYPEADNPGQVLWIIGQNWLFSRDRKWLKRVYPAVRRLADLITYTRTQPGPHWVSLDSLEFGDDLPEERRHLLKPGRCDGYHPEYTEAFDVAGLRAAAMLAHASGDLEDASRWTGLHDRLFTQYDERFGDRLADGYGRYAVLWPCRLYAPNSEQALRHFSAFGRRSPGGWRYFPLATAHQGLLAGNREAGFGTIADHLDHKQMRGWYVLDEGGRSGPGNWPLLRTTWNANVAMPHGWAVAELFLLLRDSLVYENSGQLVLLSGIDPSWFRHPAGMRIERIPTHFGEFSMRWERTAGGGVLTLAGDANPPDGFFLALPDTVAGQGELVGATRSGNGYLIESGTRTVEMTFK